MLGRALAESARAAGASVEVADARRRPWASATFVGERVEMALRVEGETAGSWLAALPNEELVLHGWLVADLVVNQAPGGKLEALVLRDG